MSSLKKESDKSKQYKSYNGASTSSKTFSNTNLNLPNAYMLAQRRREKQLGTQYRNIPACLTVYMRFKAAADFKVKTLLPYVSVVLSTSAMSTTLQ